MVADRSSRDDHARGGRNDIPPLARVDGDGKAVALPICKLKTDLPEIGVGRHFDG